MTEILKSCPFCGEKFDIADDNFLVATASECAMGDGYHDRRAVECQNCGAMGPWADTKRKAIKGWNKRASQT